MSFQRWHAHDNRTGSDESFLTGLSGSFARIDVANHQRVVAEGLYAISIEAAAVIAETAGLHDVNVDCRSGSRIARAIRSTSGTRAVSPTHFADTLGRYQRCQALRERRLSSTAAWFEHARAREELNEALFQTFDELFRFYEES